MTWFGMSFPGRSPFCSISSSFLQSLKKLLVPHPWRFKDSDTRGQRQKIVWFVKSVDRGDLGRRGGSKVRVWRICRNSKQCDEERKSLVRIGMCLRGGRFTGIRIRDTIAKREDNFVNSTQTLQQESAQLAAGFFWAKTHVTVFLKDHLDLSLNKQNLTRIKMTED